MDRDGTQAGYDVELLKAVTSRVRIPVIASGGAGKLDDFVHALKDGGADAVLAASLFHSRSLTIPQLKQYLAKEGVPVR
jgi:cyclase